MGSGAFLAKFVNKLSTDGMERLGMYYSFYRAFVDDVNDPEKLNRIKVIIPVITDNLVHPHWAFPINNFSGSGYGEKKLPKKGDIVWVSFEQGRIDLPLWQHGHFGKDEIPKGEGLDDPDAYFIVTPSGHKFIINDTKNTIYIQHKDGNEVRVDKEFINLKATKTSLSKIGASNEPAVLGNKNEEVLKSLADGIIAICDAFINSTVVTDQSGAGLKASLMSLTAQVKIDMQTLKANSIPQTKSDKVSLD